MSQFKKVQMLEKLFVKTFLYNMYKYRLLLLAVKFTALDLFNRLTIYVKTALAEARVRVYIIANALSN